MKKKKIFIIAALSALYGCFATWLVYDESLVIPSYAVGVLIFTFSIFIGFKIIEASK